MSRVFGLSKTVANTDIIIAGPHIEDNASLERRIANNIQPSTYQKSFPPIQPSTALQNYRQQVNYASSSNILFKTEHITKINAKYLPKACEPCKMTFDTVCISRPLGRRTIIVVDRKLQSSLDGEQSASQRTGRKTITDGRQIQVGL